MRTGFLGCDDMTDLSYLDSLRATYISLLDIAGFVPSEEVLEGVAAGIDLFDSTYPHSLTMKGFAMTFPLWMEQQNGYHPLSEEEHAADMDLTKIDLHSAVHR